MLSLSFLSLKVYMCFLFHQKQNLHIRTFSVYVGNSCGSWFVIKGAAPGVPTTLRGSDSGSVTSFFLVFKNFPLKNMKFMLI